MSSIHRSRHSRVPQLENLEERRVPSGAGMNASGAAGAHAVEAATVSVHPSLRDAELIKAIQNTLGRWKGFVYTKVSGGQKLSEMSRFLIDSLGTQQLTSGVHHNATSAIPPLYVTIQQPQDYFPFPNRFQVTVGSKGKNLTFQKTLKMQGLTFQIDGVNTGKTITGHITLVGPNRSLNQTYTINKQ